MSPRATSRSAKASTPTERTSTPPDLGAASFSRPAEEEPAGPLFTPEEKAAWAERYKQWDRDYKKEKATWADHEALDREFIHETRKRVAMRPQIFTDALLVIVGTRGGTKEGTREEILSLEAVFEKAGSSKRIAEIARYDTPEDRRSLHTLLRALEAIPKSWARSAFVRFLRDQGKQAQAKYDYPGKGMFGKDYGWTGDEIIAVCDVLMGNEYSGYAKMLTSFADVQSEIYQDDEELEKPGSYKATFAAVKAEPNKKLIGKICSILEERGLGPVPERRVREPREQRKLKEFVPGTIIRKGTLRDLPLPALVKVPIEKSTSEQYWKGPWVAADVEWVVKELRSDGRFVCYRPAPQTGKGGAKVAYRADSFFGERKEFLYGATYLGPWKGKFDHKQELRYKFHYRIPKDEDAVL